MFSRLSLVLLVVVLAAAALGFGFFTGIPFEVALGAKILFFLFLLPLVISFFDVLGERFRGPP